MHSGHARHGQHDCRPDRRHHTIEEILADYPLEREDVLQALRYAAWLAEDREVVLPGA